MECDHTASGLGREKVSHEVATAVPVWVGRVLLGALLGTTLGTVGAGIGWALYVFFGAVSLTTLLILLMGGVAVGAAAGVFLAWLRFDYNPPLLLSVTVGALLLAAIGGAWGGFEYGAAREVPCCAKPDVTPITYVVLGSTAATSAVGLLLGIAPQVVAILRRKNRPGRFR